MSKYGMRLSNCVGAIVGQPIINSRAERASCTIFTFGMQACGGLLYLVKTTSCSLLAVAREARTRACDIGRFRGDPRACAFGKKVRDSISAQNPPLYCICPTSTADGLLQLHDALGLLVQHVFGVALRAPGAIQPIAWASMPLSDCHCQGPRDVSCS